MNTGEVNDLLQEIDPGAPCGPNLEYDPVFVALELAVLGKPEVQYGETITAAVPPEWKVVRKMAAELLARSRDLRLAVYLLRAELALVGIEGMATGLHLIERLLDERWDSVHPELDADDDNDPMLRINSLTALTDAGTVLKDLKETALIVLPGLGPLTLRMLEVASGELAPPKGTEKIAVESIDKALADVDDTALGAAVERLTRALDSVVNIETLLVRQVGSSQALNLDALTKPLKRGRDFLAQRAGARAPAADAGVDAAGAGADGDAPAGAGVAGARGAPISGAIANRADVVRMLDKLLEYYHQHEPSSPLPLLLERAKRLVPKNFMEILQDLAPDGLSQLNVIKGPDQEQ
ncbi:MAG: type VI secretion system protein TssA [Telluria sp.]